MKQKKENSLIMQTFVPFLSFIQDGSKISHMSFSNTVHSAVANMMGDKQAMFAISYIKNFIRNNS